MATFEEQLADYAWNRFQQRMPAAALAATKVRVVDTVGCAIGALAEDPLLKAQSLMARDDFAAGKAHTWGSGYATTVELATFLNSAASRLLDFNDVYLGREGGHPSDGIAAAWAVAEAFQRSGLEFLQAVAVGYQIHCVLADSASLRDRGFDNVLYGGISAAVMAALLMGLGPLPVSEAIRIVTASSVPLLQTRYGELSMWKGLAAAQAAKNGVFAAYAAAAGIKGPPKVFEGPKGLIPVLATAFTAPDWDDPTWKVEKTRLKPYAAQYPLLTAIEAAIRLRERVQPEALASLRIVTFPYAIDIAAKDPEKWHPATRETADHSLPYCVAVAFLTGTVGPQSFAPRYLHDPELLTILAKIQVQADPEAHEDYPADTPVRLQAIGHDGTQWEERVPMPLGSFERPLTDPLLKAKFLSLGPQAPSQMLTLWDALRQLDQAHRLPRIRFPR